MTTVRLAAGSCLAALTIVLAIIPWAAAQPPKESPKWPPIAPDKARLEQTFRGLDGPGLCLAGNDTASMVAAGCEQHTIQFWHKDAVLGLRDGSSSTNVLTGHAGAVLALDWRGSVLASAGADKKILLWEMPEGKILHSLEAAPLVRCLALSPDGKTLVTGGDAPDLRVWDVEKGKPVGDFKGHTDWVQCVAFSDDGKHLVSGGYEGALLWDAGDGKKLRELPAPPKDKPKTPPDPDPVSAVTFSPDGKQALLGYSSGNIDQVNVADGQKIRALTGHTSAVTRILFHPAGTLAVSCSKDGSIRLWNPANGTLIKALTDHTAWVEGIALVAQGTRLVSVSADQTVRVWNLTGP